ncbi:hypothetical protein AWZ03_010342 [Drosophila navojoa]|uniref:Uncharacterized protein n=1 Tax=Drosophila navojoa TaxID=7232 RepID=A0A484B3E4_DRONA|nr:hypothetical protein AWZ03_010342 [Drosophila navojoa]
MQAATKRPKQLHSESEQESELDSGPSWAANSSQRTHFSGHVADVVAHNEPQTGSGAGWLVGWVVEWASSSNMQQRFLQQQQQQQQQTGCSKSNQ